MIEKIERFSLEESSQRVRATFSNEDTNFPYYSTSWYKYSTEVMDFENNTPKDYAKELEKFYKRNFKSICIYYKYLAAQEVISKYKGLEESYKIKIGKINDEITKKLLNII